MDCVFMRNGVVLIEEIIRLVPNDRMDYIVSVLFRSMVFVQHCKILTCIPKEISTSRLNEETRLPWIRNIL